MSSHPEDPQSKELFWITQHKQFENISIKGAGCDLQGLQSKWQDWWEPVIRQIERGFTTFNQYALDIILDPFQ